MIKLWKKFIQLPGFFLADENSFNLLINRLFDKLLANGVLIIELETSKLSSIKFFSCLSNSWCVLATSDSIAFSFVSINFIYAKQKLV